MEKLNATTGEIASLKSQSRFEIEMSEKKCEEEMEKILFEISVHKSRATSSRENGCCPSINTEDEDEAVLRYWIEERDRLIVELETQLLKL